MDSKKLQNLPLHTNQNYLKSLDFFWALSFLSAYVIIKTGLYHPPLWSAFTLTKRLLKICQREERAAAELLYLLLSWCFERDICVWQIFCPSVFSSTWFFAQHFFACTIPKWLWSDNKRAFWISWSESAVREAASYNLYLDPNSTKKRIDFCNNSQWLLSIELKLALSNALYQQGVPFWKLLI